MSTFSGDSAWTRSFYRFVDTAEGPLGEEIRSIESDLFHYVSFMTDVWAWPISNRVYFKSAKPALEKAGLWKTGGEAVGDQREADKNVSGILYRSIKHQKGKAQKDKLGVLHSQFNM